MKRCPVCKTAFTTDANFCPMDAAQLVDDPSTPTPSLDLPTMQARLVGGRFRLGPQIGGARTGEVFSAEDITTSAPCAVKIVNPAVFPTPLVAQRTERELKQLMKVTSDRIARVLDVGRQHDRLFVALELVSGMTLTDLMSQSGPLPVDQAVRLVLEVGEGLAEAAKLGVIHRDVSPKNIMLLADARAPGGRRVKIINFGIATPVGDKVFGMPEFLSPEQAEGKPVDQRSNIYSLGVLLYTLIAGEAPFAGDPNSVLTAHTSTPPVPPSQRVADVPADVERTILKALEKSSSRRHLTLRQLLGELETALGHLPSSSPLAVRPPAVAPPPGKPRPGVRTSGGVAAQSSRRHSAAAKTMVGIGIKDLFPGGQPHGQGAQEPPATSGKQRAVIVPEPAPPELPLELMQTGRPESSGATQQYGQGSGRRDGDVPDTQGRRPVTAPVDTPDSGPSVTFNKPSARSGRDEDRHAHAGPAGKRGPFRETLWFKKGEVDDQVASDEAEAGEAPLVIDDSGIQERYKDDGSVTAADRDRLSLRGGGAEARREGRRPARSKVSEKDLLADIRNPRARLIAIGAALAAVVILLVLFLVLR